jgi:hypothetical protein
MPNASPVARLASGVHQKLVNLLGEQQANALYAGVLTELRLPALETAEDCHRFGVAVAARGGMLAVLGRSIQTQAQLRGAVGGTDGRAGRPLQTLR